MLQPLRRALLCNIAVIALFLLHVSLEHHCTGEETQASRDEPLHGLGVLRRELLVPAVRRDYVLGKGEGLPWEGE